MPVRAVSSWVVTDGKAGMENQCLGLAAALGLTPAVKRIRLRSPWRQLTPYLRLGGQMQFAPGCGLSPPWPDLLIATGRESIAASLYVREESRKAGTRTLTVQLQNPVVPSRHFDLVITPRHDRLAGDNVVATRGALHRVTGEILSAGAARLAPRIANLPRPFIAALIGGSNAAYRMTPAGAKALGAQLAAAAREKGGSLIVTPSRRTSEACVAALKGPFSAVPHFFWDSAGDNPYFGILGLADFIVVTADSINMVSEALATGKPVYVAALAGGSAKFERFHAAMRDDGLTRVFTGTLDPYVYAPPDDMGIAAVRAAALMAPLGREHAK